MEYSFEEGGIWEEKKFIIKVDYQLNKSDNKCRHVFDNKVKFVVIAENEGGYNNTGVCLECIIEAGNCLNEK